MSTKAKCFALANQHGITIEYYFDDWRKSSSVDLPDGFVDDNGRTGLCFESYEDSAKEFWKAVYGDIQTIVACKDRWQKSPYNETGK
jgi:hypothetical protein